MGRPRFALIFFSALISTHFGLARVPQQENALRIAELYVQHRILAQKYLIRFDEQLARQAALHRSGRAEQLVAKASPMAGRDYRHLLAAKKLSDQFMDQFLSLHFLNEPSLSHEQFSNNLGAFTNALPPEALSPQFTYYLDLLHALREAHELKYVSSPPNFFSAHDHPWSSPRPQFSPNKKKALNQMALAAEDSRELRLIAEQILPSPGSEGNITGNSFPSGVWAMTFDDGPSPRYTPEIRSAAASYGVPLTFFWLAEKILNYPDVFMDTLALGFSIQNHSYSHANLPRSDDATLKREIVESTKVINEALHDAGGEPLRFMRLPYGAGLNNRKIREMIAAQGLVHVFWNVDSLDWQDKDPNSILERIHQQMEVNGSGIILMHDVHPQSVAAARELFRDLATGGGLRSVSMPEIVDELNSSDP